MHKALSVKSRVRGDFHARFCERVRVKLPRSTRPWPDKVTEANPAPNSSNCVIRKEWFGKRDEVNGQMAVIRQM